MSFPGQAGLYKETVSRLAGVIGFTYLVQTAFAAVAVPLQTEKFYDIAGACGFLTSTILSAYYPSFRSLLPVSFKFANVARPLDPAQRFGNPLTVLGGRQLLLSLMVLTWTSRLGSFLAQRIMKDGKDSRFDEIKKDPLKFSGAWLGQATWITLTGLPVYLINSIPRNAQPRIGLVDVIGFSIWASGFMLEVTADRQKSAWRERKNEKKHDEAFVKDGVWSWSRHPNYAGEVALWGGLSVVASNALFTASTGTAAFLPAYYPYLAFLSPAFTYLLLKYASGVPLLEQSAEKKWGDREDWKEYKKKVPVLFGWPGSKI
ncbi:hypothetical protein QFC21_004526 [Naganishia friedmannii]|uniref:Uncharacterized protein n=1 Tax=Naganishia friedmannii TaxID=89922 RepID=A0ACC2VFV2_9TREE|nr:hypothetical protein QFC21_004526 [Naganishia friedmannii]